MDPMSALPPFAERPVSAPRIKPGAPPEAVQATAKDFESMVIGELIGPMFDALDSDGLGGGGAGEKMFRPMLVHEYAKSLAASGGIGLSQSVADEMNRLQMGGPSGHANSR